MYLKKSAQFSFFKTILVREDSMRGNYPGCINNAYKSNSCVNSRCAVFSIL